jgi:hypothetical protein
VGARSSLWRQLADVMHVIRPSFLLRRPGALTIAAVAVVDVAYRLLLRASVRRMLGMRSQP